MKNRELDFIGVWLLQLTWAISQRDRDFTDFSL